MFINILIMRAASSVSYSTGKEKYTVTQIIQIEAVLAEDQLPSSAAEELYDMIMSFQTCPWSSLPHQQSINKYVKITNGI